LTGLVVRIRKGDEELLTWANKPGLEKEEQKIATN
jgi:hypothetical protein|tara:strand:- start:128 stop:232 length:105 start_codon:yes stop_codon:yes gene_type:complete